LAPNYLLQLIKQEPKVGGNILISRWTLQASASGDLDRVTMIDEALETGIRELPSDNSVAEVYLQEMWFITVYLFILIQRD
jgi:hypothetical protein